MDSEMNSRKSGTLSMLKVPQYHFWNSSKVIEPLPSWSTVSHVLQTSFGSSSLVGCCKSLERSGMNSRGSMAPDWFLSKCRKICATVLMSRMTFWAALEPPCWSSGGFSACFTSSCCFSTDFLLSSFTVLWVIDFLMLFSHRSKLLSVGLLNVVVLARAGSLRRIGEESTGGVGDLLDGFSSDALLSLLNRVVRASHIGVVLDRTVSGLSSSHIGVVLHRTVNGCAACSGLVSSHSGVVLHRDDSGCCGGCSSPSSATDLACRTMAMAEAQRLRPGSSWLGVTER
mmetsp:Transcript_84606/g.224656  ORF Transcript_84606/g.224656 Transcript_84606/m.224656 type:complete len:285 (-) Transcript_84606:142-996(-)